MSRRGDPSYELEGNRENNQETLADVLSKFLDAGMRSHMSAAQRAAAAWYGANGDVERAHTTGVFLKRPRHKGDPPILGVYVDSHSRLTDFTVNREIYLARLHNVGLEVSGIEFKLTQRGVEKGASAGTRASRGADTVSRSGARRVSPSSTTTAQIELPELNDEQRAEVARATEGLPDSLRTKVSSAMIYSMRRRMYDAGHNKSDGGGSAGK